MSNKTIKFRKAPGKILVIKPSSLGDVVHSLPFLNVLRERFPKADIHWVIARGLEGLLEGHPIIRKLWIINKDEWKKLKGLRTTMAELRALFGSLKDERFDLVIDLQGLLRSGILSKATGSPIRVGFKEAREGSRFFYTHAVKGGKERHAVDRYLEIAKFLGCDVSEVKFPFPLSFDLNHVAATMNLPDKYAVIVPGARWETKRWRPERFGELASAVPVKFIVIGGKSDAGIAEEVIRASRGKALSLAGKTSIKELIDLIRNAEFVVTNDSGPMHIAAALGVPVFAIFGPTNPVKTGPYGKGHIIIRKALKCSPCYKKTCKDVRCMNNINVREVAEAILGSLSKKGC